MPDPYLHPVHSNRDRMLHTISFTHAHLISIHFKEQYGVCKTASLV